MTPSKWSPVTLPWISELSLSPKTRNSKVFFIETPTERYFQVQCALAFYIASHELSGVNLLIAGFTTLVDPQFEVVGEEVPVCLQVQTKISVCIEP